MATTFSERDAALDAIAAVMSDQNGQLQQIKSSASQVSAALAALPTDFADEIADIGTEAAANPNDVSLQNHKAKLDNFTTEFLATKAITDGIVSDIG